MKKIPMIMILSLLGSVLFSQTIDRQFIGPAGTSSQGELINLDWTLGEHFNSNYHHAEIDFKEGFLQPDLWLNDYSEDLNLVISNVDKDAIGEVYPNPFENRFNFSLIEPFEKELHIRVVDISGEVKVFKILPAGEQSLEIDLSNCSAGMYVLQIINVLQSSQTTYKIMRQW